MLPVQQKTPAEETFELIGFVLAAVIFFTILYFIISKLTHNQNITLTILAGIILGLLLVAWVNKKYKKWVW